jgi:3-dehydroquinate synthetase
VAEGDTATRVRDAVRRAGLPAERPPRIDPEQIVAATRVDKKARGGNAEFAIPRRVGAMAGERDGWAVRVPEALVLEVLR